MIRIVTDSAADMEAEELERFDIESVPLSVTFGDKTYLDGVTLSKDDFFELLASEKEFPKTSQPSPESFLKVFEKAKKAGDSVICILLSQALSGTYQSALIAKDMAEYDDIHIINSKLASGGEMLLCRQAALMRDKGMGAEKIVKEIEALRDRARIVAGLDTLEYLCKGGRLSKAAAGIGTLANIKPVIRVTEEGEVALCEKCIGRKAMLKKLIKRIEDTGIDTSLPISFLYACDRTGLDNLMEKLEQMDFDISNHTIHNIGPTIGAHIGIGGYGIMYFVPVD